MPYISVVLSNYNGATYLTEAVKSILFQSYKDFEVILVDDASTDDSAQIIDRFTAQVPNTIKKVTHDTNKGQAEGFNSGIQSAKGTIICLMDSDDLWFPNKLSGVADYFALAPSCVMLQHNLYFRQGDVPTKIRFRNFSVVGEIVDYTQCLRGGRLPQFIPTTGLSFKADALRQVLPIPSCFRTCADGYLTRTVMTLGSVGFVDECWGEYRVHGKNNTFANRFFDQQYYIFKQLMPALNTFYSAHGVSLRFPEFRRERWLLRLCEGVNALFDIAGFGDLTKSACHKLIAGESLSASQNKRKIRSYKNVHRGRRAFIIGMGPSLEISDLVKLKGEITFACNKIFLAFEQVEWRPTYYSVLDVLVAKNNASEISKLNLVKFFSASCRKYFNEDEAIWLNDLASQNDKYGNRIYSFSEDLTSGVYGGFTVVYLQLQLAWYMGIKEIYLIGLDFNFDYGARQQSGEKCEHGDVLVSRGEINHFHPDYRKKGETWTVPQLEKQSIAFRVAREFFEANGGKIYNASRRTKLDVFDRINFDDVLTLRQAKYSTTS